MKEKLIKVLYVEDEEIDYTLLMRTVKDKELPYDVDLARNVLQALEKLRNKKYDVVLLDYHLPDGTGLDILAGLKDVPSIFLTGSGDETVAANAIQGGAYDYIIKDPECGYLELVPLAVDKALHTFRLEEAHTRAEEELKKISGEEKKLTKLLIKREFVIKKLKDEVNALRRRTESKGKKREIHE